MKEPLSSKDRVYRAYYQDGSVDLFAGLGALLIGSAWLFDLVLLGPLAPVFAIPAWMSFRRRVVEPRLGHVTFDEGRRMQLRRSQFVLLLIGCGTLILGVVVYFVVADQGPSEAGGRNAIAGLPGVLLGIGGLLCALMFQMPRFAAYGLAFALAGLGVVILDTDPGWGLLVGGLVTTLAGCALFTRFLREFPALPAELE